ncbi:MAG TPA: zinc-binding alcohol dehydrogenase family protein [Polyangiaceae bacterium]|nr:zinc-binding alcohol dehydrogenase family protein [Polyangiaceae bacterium]
MRALLIDRHAPHTELALREVPTPALPAGHVRVEVLAAAVNPSDVASAEGRFAYARLPRVLGRDFAGRVIEGPAEWLGAEVWGTGGDLGITRDGAHAEQVVLPMESVSRRPAKLSVEGAAAAGVPFTTAWLSLVECGRLAEGEWVVIAGAAGAVGLAAIELAGARGARVVALVRDDEEAARLDRTKVAAVATSERGDVVAVTRSATDDRGADLALNGVGAVVFQPLFDALRDGGRMVVFSAAAGREAPLDLFTLYRRRLELIGVNTGVLTAADGARILTELVPLFERGAIAPHPSLELHPLSAASTAYARVASGAPAKLVLVPDARLSQGSQR